MNFLIFAYLWFNFLLPGRQSGRDLTSKPAALKKRVLTLCSKLNVQKLHSSELELWQIHCALRLRSGRCCFSYKRICRLILGASLVAQMVKNLPVVRETQKMWVWSLDWGDSLEEEMATHSRTVAWGIPWITMRILVGYTLWGHKELDTTEWPNTHKDAHKTKGFLSLVLFFECCILIFPPDETHTSRWVISTSDYSNAIPVCGLW